MSTLIGSTNEDYHANRTHLSSSGLKLLLKDPQSFYARYVLGNYVEESKPAYEDGTLLHSLILEPEQVVSQYAIFPGLRKHGKAFDDFKAQNPGKRIISAPQLNKAESWHRGFKALPVANQLISGGFAEHTMLGELLGVKIKSRADYINVSEGYIADIKTTSAYTDVDVFRQTMQDFGYALSASLYCEIAYQTYGKLFDFYFVVVSKQDSQCAVYKASSDTLTHGRSELISALVLYKRCLETGLWQFDQPRKDYSTQDYEIQEV